MYVNSTLSDRNLEIVLNLDELLYITILVYYKMLFTNLFSSCFVTNCRSEMYFVPAVHGTVMTAYKHTKTRFLENQSVVVVRIAHGPAADVASSVLYVTTIYVATVAVGPFLEYVILVDLK